MELSEIISLNPDELNDEAMEELFRVLIGIANVDEVPKKILRKTLALCLASMKQKGEQINTLREQQAAKIRVDSEGDDSRHSRIREENEKLTRMVNKLEDDKAALKSKLKEMHEETTHLQKRLAEAMRSNDSDKDSSDPLSELDRQEELLKNINVKNKHIKRLLKEIEALQTNNIEQSKTIIDLEKLHQHAKIQIQELTAKFVLVEGEKKALNNTINELTAEVTRLEGNITYLEDEREKSELDLKRLVEKLDSECKSWQATIKEKEKEIKKLKAKVQNLREVTAKEEDQDEKESESEMDRLAEESAKMMHAIEARDKVIEKLESKIKAMADEMISSTNLMNKLSAEREDERSQESRKSRACCKSVEEALKSCNERCRSLSDLLEKSEEDNILRSQQAAQALASLDAYQRGEDGLANALRKIASLEKKLSAREKKIRSLVTEVNALHEVSSENSLLRKKLNIPDDVVITAKNALAKERSKDKQIERLTLKLRASEEMRLQLKLEKSDLRKKLLQLQGGTRCSRDSSSNSSSPKSVKSSPKSQKNSPQKTRPEIYCDNCLKNIQSLPNKDSVLQDVIKEWEGKYTEVIEENENLRVGMHEILEKIREYDGTSDHITIDCEILERLLHALDARSISGWYHPAMRIQNELIALKEREQTLREKINAAAIPDSVPSQQESFGEVREAGEIPETPLPSLPPVVFDSSTRPTTPNKTLDQSLYPVIVEADIEHESLRTDFLRILEKNRSLQQEVSKLQIFETHFQELTLQMSASDGALTKYCAEVVEKLSNLETQMLNNQKTYEFLKEDFDRTLTESKASEMRNITLIAELKKQINDRKHDISVLKAENESLSSRVKSYNAEECAEMRKTLYNLQAQVAQMIDEVFSGKVPNVAIKEISAEYGVIQENLELDIITAAEYEDMKREVGEREARDKDLQVKCDHLESLLVIANEQVITQQRLLMEITDNHINLRHLVADLQSSSEDKFLIAKIQRELNSAKSEVQVLKIDKEKLEQNAELLKQNIAEKDRQLKDTSRRFQTEIRNYEVKNKFLQKSLQGLRQKYFKFTPLIFLSNFVYSYAKHTKTLRNEEHNIKDFLSRCIDDVLSSKIDTPADEDSDSQNRIKLVKTETRAKYLEDQVNVLNQKNLALQNDIDQLRLSVANESEHWRTIDVLFGSNIVQGQVEQEVQTEVKEIVDSTMNTDPEAQPDEAEIRIVEKVDKNLSPIASPKRKPSDDGKVCYAETQTSPKHMTSKQTSPAGSPVKQVDPVVSTLSLESRGVQTSEDAVDSRVSTNTQGMQTSPTGSPKRQSVAEEDPKIKELEEKLREMTALSEDRMAQLGIAETRLMESNRTIEALEKKVQEQQEEIQKRKQTETDEKTNYQAGIIEKTILSFHTLLSEKDKSINQYQELLTSERSQNEVVCKKYDKEIEGFVQKIQDLQTKVKTKDEEILELKTKIEASAKVSKEKVEMASGVDDNGDNSLQEISDEKIEEMFDDDGASEESVRKPTEVGKDLYLMELKSREKFWENTLKVKEEEIGLLKEKLRMYQEREKLDTGLNPEMEQLRTLLEEKDKHINDLMDTLTNFHDDQQRFLTDSTTYSADQISKLAANLTRSEATNKIYQAQLEAMRRQLANLHQREKQARDLNNTLRNQLIKRPVVSIKTELNARLKSENLQKKVNQLEADLEEAHIQIKRQQVIIDAKRARSNNEVGLWEKQKRWQQSAEKFKAKLEETEATLEKQKHLLNSARTTIARLEKDKQILEARVGKAPSSLKCCRTPSCPNLQGTKYSPSETPETYTGDSECSSSAGTVHFLGGNHNELIEALKARIEMQQRKIIAMEMEGRGNNTLTTELEKLQEKYSAIEAQNIRLEARNLQFQLDNDLLRQGDSGERMQKRIKHLEDYIIALKEELAQAEARRQVDFEHKTERTQKYAPGQAEQTILSLRSIIEKLRIDNKCLKEGRRTCDSRDHDIPMEMKRLQNMYTESLDKISALQIELQLKARCQNCGNKGRLETAVAEDLHLIKEQLLKKTQLLEKAKILLTRAAAKEKVLKEQLSLWKRKCSELQNVPVIDEISE